MLRIALLAAFVAALPAGASPEGDLKKAIALYDDFQPEQAAQLLRPLTQPTAPAPVRARAWLYLGLCLGTLADEAGAREAFRAAFQLDPALKLPDSAAELKPVAEAEREAVKAAVADKARADAEAKA